MDTRIQDLHHVSDEMYRSLCATIDVIEDQKKQLDGIFTLIPELNQRLKDLAMCVDKFVV